ncbi:MAG TPA: hypothetical protein VGQ83_23125 [Polyangia bacterium]|jgi:hypothetical protein
MYLTSHLVRTPAHDHGGVNTFIYTHHGASSPAIDWADPDIRRIAEEQPGSLVAAITSVPAGGNEVLAYLDVVAPEGLSSRAVAHEIPSALPGGTPPIVWRAGRLTLRYGTVIGLEPRANALFALLAGELCRILGTQKALTPAPRLRGPLRLNRTADSVGFRYQLSPESRAALREIAPGRALPATLAVTFENQDDFVTVFGAPFAEFARLLTGLTLVDIKAAGGIEVWDEGGGMIWRSLDR